MMTVYTKNNGNLALESVVCCYATPLYRINNLSNIKIHSIRDIEDWVMSWQQIVLTAGTLGSYIEHLWYHMWW